MQNPTSEYFIRSRSCVRTPPHSYPGNDENPEEYFHVIARVCGTVIKEL
jgi:hypothetical protein